MKINRLIAIEEYVNEKGVAKLTELQEYFDVSMSTIRRDIDTLNEQGRITKAYGCILKKEQEDKPLLPFHDRSNIAAKEKKRAAEVAASFVKDNDIIFIDSGSTTCLMVDYLQERKNVTIVTNNLDVVMRSVPYPNLHVLVFSGMLNRENNSFTILDTSTIFSGFNVTKAFFAASGVHLGHGVSHTEFTESHLKKTALGLRAERFLVVDSSKFGQVAPMNFAQATDFPTICTDQPPAKEYLDFFATNGVVLKSHEKAKGN